MIPVTCSRRDEYLSISGNGIACPIECVRALITGVRRRECGGGSAAARAQARARREHQLPGRDRSRTTTNINKTGQHTPLPRHQPATISQWRNCKMLDRKGLGFKLLIFMSEILHIEKFNVVVLMDICYYEHVSREL